jgi:RimJ/RimL family protein N-acetyltransferase
MHVRRLTPAHAAEYRALMLRAYAEEPVAFTSTVSERAALPLAWWAARVSDGPNPAELVYGAFADAVGAPGAGGRLVGVAGLRFERRERTRHKATLFGTYVLPEYRGRGVGRALVEAVLAHARSTPGLRVVQLTVTEPNAAARRLYAACGFVPFGTEPLANRDGDGFVAVVNLWREDGPGG